LLPQRREQLDMVEKAVIETLARLEHDLAEQGKAEYEAAVREAINALARSNGLLTTGQAAERLHVSVPTIKRWIERGALAGVATGTRWLVSEADVDRLVRVERNLAELDAEGNPTDEEMEALYRRPRRNAEGGKERVA
jgi:excisionase family DNA binding protein